MTLLYKFDLAALDRLSPGEQQRAIELLRKFRDRQRYNPIEAYAPLPPQREFHEATQRLRGFFGGNRAGKTTCGLIDDLIQACPESLLTPEQLRWKRFECPFYCRVVCPDYSNVLVPVILQKLRQWTPLALLRDQSFDKAYDSQNHSLRLECGCRFDFMTYMQELKSFGGAALHRCHYDEEPPQDIRNECKARLLDFPGADEILTMTPLDGMTPWAYDEVWMKRDTERVFCVQGDMEANPHLDEEAVREYLDSLGKDERSARAHGNFVHFGGKVYPDWGLGKCAPPSKEVVKAHDDHVVAIDPGVRWTGVAYVAFDGENNALQFDETKMEDATVPEVAAEIRRVLNGWGLEFDDVVFVIDPAAAARSHADGVKLETEYQVHGIYAQHAYNDVEAGVAMMRRRLKGRGFRWSTACTETDWEARRYRIDAKNADGSQKSRFQVVKEHDHLMDADRYAIMSRPWYDEVPLPEEREPEDVAFLPPKRGDQEPGVAGQYA